MLKPNMHMIERVLRGLVGITLIILVFVGPKIAWGWIGLVPLLTALVGICPAYIPFNFSTCPEVTEQDVDKIVNTEQKD